MARPGSLLKETTSSVRLPEAADRVLGDVLQCLVQRHDHRAEVADLVPPVAVAPPHDLDLVALAGRPQPGDRPAGVFAEERVALRRLLDQDAAALLPVE